MLNFFKNLLKEKEHWACHYKVTLVGTNLVTESGTFALTGTDYNHACSNAKETIRKWVRYDCNVKVEISLSKPSWLRFLRE